VVNFSPLAASRELKYQLTDAETQVMITLHLPMLYLQIAAFKGIAEFETLVVCSIEDFFAGTHCARLWPAGGSRRRSRS
jgi:hypothetical protein